MHVIESGSNNTIVKEYLISNVNFNVKEKECKMNKLLTTISMFFVLACADIEQPEGIGNVWDIIVFNREGIDQIEYISGDTFKVANYTYKLWGYKAPIKNDMCGNINCVKKSILELTRIIDSSQSLECRIRSINNKQRVVECYNISKFKDIVRGLILDGFGFEDIIDSNGYYKTSTDIAKQYKVGVWNLK